MTNVVVVGAGKIGERHAAVYQALDSARLVGIVEPVDDRFQAIAGSSDLRRYPKLDDALSDPEVEVIDVCTPTPLHFGQAHASLVAGKHVFCEKPLVTSLTDVKALAAVLAPDQTLRVAYPYRLHPRLVALRDRLQSGALGRPHSALLRIGGRGSHRAWKHRRSEGGGAMLDMATHMVDLAYWLFGAFESAEVLASDLVVPQRMIDGELVLVDADDLAVLRVRTVSGVDVMIYADFMSPGFANTIEVAGSTGSAFVSAITSLPDRYVLLEASGDLPAGETIRPGANADMLAMELESFVHAINAGEVVQDVESSMAVTSVIETYTLAAS